MAKRGYNRGTKKLERINAEAHKIRNKHGFKTKTIKKKDYKMAWTEAISIATDRLYGKNRSGYMDGVGKRKKSSRKRKARKGARS